MTLQEFITENTGKIIGVNPIDTGQCTGLVMKWYESNNIPFEYGNAKDLLDNANTQYFDVVTNTADNIPTPGDVMVWGKQVGVDGHTSLFISGDTNTFNSFDQNWPLNSTCHIQHHNYSGVIGWLHPKVIQSPQLPIMPPYLSQLFQEQNLDPSNEGAVRSFWQQAIDEPNIKKDLDASNASNDIKSQKINDLTLINNQQVQQLSSLQQQLAVCRENPVIPPNSPSTKPTGFWAKLAWLFG